MANTAKSMGGPNEKGVWVASNARQLPSLALWCAQNPNRIFFWRT